MKKFYPLLQLCLLLFISSSANAQDTLLLHYADATISEILSDSSGEGSYSGKGDDMSIGKYMFFNSDLHKSPTTHLVSILMDLEVSNYNETDSFNVFAQRIYNGDIVDEWDTKFPFSSVLSNSIPIEGNDVASYNFVVDDSNFDIDAIGHLEFNVGIRYHYNSDAKIALRATGDGEFIDANNRCFTINDDGSVSDFVSMYNSEVGLAIYPVTELTGNALSLSDIGIVLKQFDGNKIQISSKNSTETYELGLYNIQGYSLMRKTIKPNSVTSLECSHLPTGIYILNAWYRNTISQTKIFIE